MSRLLIFDKAETKDDYTDLLEGFDYTLDVDADPLTVAKTIQRLCKTVDGVIISLDDRGMQALKHLSGLRLGIPVIGVCVSLNVDAAAWVKQNGATDVLYKPLDKGRLLAAVQSALAGPESSPLLAPLEQRLVGKSQPMIELRVKLAKLIPKQDAAVLLCGRTGVGKGLVAQAIAELGPTKRQPLLYLNVANLSATLLESQLFGHERGAFTGATDRHIGFFEKTDGGVLFLDEIGELPLELQPKLLGVLEDGKFVRLGGTTENTFHGRLVFATNRDLTAEVKAGRFREDLYFRINRVEIEVPTLRERRDDILILADFFLRKHDDAGRTRAWSPEARRVLEEYEFPGEIRQLENIVRRTLMECRGDEITLFDLPLKEMARDQRGDGVEIGIGNGVMINWPTEWLTLPRAEALALIAIAFDQVYLPRVYEANNRIQKNAAVAAGIDVKTFREKWKDAGLQ